MPLLNKLGQILPYFIVSKLVNKVAPRSAFLVSEDTKIPVNVIVMSNDEWIVRRKNVR
jgi:hypothetical protein